AIGAAIEIGALRRAAVVAANEVLRGVGDLMDGAEIVVRELRLIWHAGRDERPACIGRPRLVAGVGHGRGVAGRPGRAGIAGIGGDAEAAGEATLAELHEFLVPYRRGGQRDA